MLLIKGGTVHDGKGGILEATDILVAEGRIAAIGPGLAAPAAAEVVDAREKLVLPGFIDALNNWGAFGPGIEERDLAEHSAPVTPEMNVVYSFDPAGMLYQGVYEYGVTAAGITPAAANVVGGQVAVFKTYGTHPYAMLIREQAAMAASVTAAPKKQFGARKQAPMTRMGGIALLQQALAKAERYRADRGYDSRSLVLKQVLDGEMPLFVNCNTRGEMDAVELALRDYPLEIVFTGAFGAGEGIRRNLIVGDLTYAGSEEKLALDFASLAELAASGVEIAISSCGDRPASGKESLLWNAMLWHKHGFSSGEVLKMVTSVPARLLGIDERTGSLEPGKDADLVIWSTNPLESFSAVAEAVYVGGENVFKAGRKRLCW